jgi:hypothetical protein
MTPHLLSLTVGVHPDPDPAARERLDSQREALLAHAGLTACTATGWYAPPPGLPYHQQHRRITTTVHALSTLGYPVTRIHHARRTG